MEQFRQIGEVLGSLKALMVFQTNIQVNQKQCRLLLDICDRVYNMVAEDIQENLKFQDKNIKWKVIEQPLKELYKIFKEVEAYIRQSLDYKDRWANAITLYRNTDCVHLHIHNLLWCVHLVKDAIELATTQVVSSRDQDETKKRRFVYSNKYKTEWNDSQLFRWKFGKEYLVTQGICDKMDTVWKEDRLIFLNKIQNMGLKKREGKLMDVLIRNMNGSDGKLLPSSILVSCADDYQVRRRLGDGGQYKEITWLGESFALRHFFGDIKVLAQEIDFLLTLSHPNISYYFCGFADEEKKECFLVMELMNRNLRTYMKEICGSKRRIPFSLLVAVDLMLQVARGMEYLHSKMIYHGDLNPSNILVKTRSCCSTNGYLSVKVSGFDLTSIKSVTQKSCSNVNEASSFIWHAPEVLDENGSETMKYTEKSDVYSFGMICFEVLTGKVPFEDNHLQGEKMSRNIRAGERPLFPFHSPKYMTNFTKKCWHSDPNQRPSFSSICRILRYTKKFLVMNPDHNSQSDSPTPTLDYCDIESKLLRKFTPESLQVSEIPFQMFAYRVVENERSSSTNLKDTSESESEKASVSEDEIVAVVNDDPFQVIERSNTVPAKSLNNVSLKKSSNKQPGTVRGRSIKPPQTKPSGRNMRMKSESQLIPITPRLRRTTSGHASDSELTKSKSTR